MANPLKRQVNAALFALTPAPHAFTWLQAPRHARTFNLAGVADTCFVRSEALRDFADQPWLEAENDDANATHGCGGRRAAASPGSHHRRDRAFKNRRL